MFICSLFKKSRVEAEISTCRKRDTLLRTDTIIYVIIHHIFGGKNKDIRLARIFFTISNDEDIFISKKKIGSPRKSIPREVPHFDLISYTPGATNVHYIDFEVMVQRWEENHDVYAQSTDGVIYVGE